MRCAAGVRSVQGLVRLCQVPVFRANEGACVRFPAWFLVEMLVISNPHKKHLNPAQNAYLPMRFAPCSLLVRSSFALPWMWDVGCICCDCAKVSLWASIALPDRELTRICAIPRLPCPGAPSALWAATLIYVYTGPRIYKYIDTYIFAVTLRSCV